MIPASIALNCLLFYTVSDRVHKGMLYAALIFALAAVLDIVGDHL